MKHFYEKQPVWFAVMWILAYCLILAPLRGNFGDASVAMLAGLAVFSAALLALVKSWGLGEALGLTRWPKNTKRYLYFLPAWILATGNLWGGAEADYSGVSQLLAILSMLLVGFVEEMVFRGLLFRGLLAEKGPVPAVIVSAVTFGIGHIVNLLTGQGGLDTLVQMAFAVSWGFMLTYIYCKSGSLLPCIVLHALIDLLSTYGADVPAADYIYVGATILGGIIYSVYLSKQPSAFADGKGGKARTA